MIINIILITLFYLMTKYAQKEGDKENEYRKHKLSLNEPLKSEKNFYLWMVSLLFIYVFGMIGGLFLLLIFGKFLVNFLVNDFINSIPLEFNLGFDYRYSLIAFIIISLIFMYKNHYEGK
ncbi:hypothetical protein I6I99_14665 [Sphingobacterium multivorum]|nr:hypothetical protein [Sphingobacterium multivorum]QQT28605.1 hypothetical protein I6I99_14665 [Sphingobacterium multivorum]